MWIKKVSPLYASRNSGARQHFDVTALTPDQSSI
jgi:hypothetical protein